MAIIGLDSTQTPFKYLDEYMEAPDWEKLHNEVSLGIAKAEWSKKFVSSGVHKNWAEKEITTTFMDLKNKLTEEQLKIFVSLNSTDEKIKFLNALTHTPHPFWVIFLRWNKRVEKTGVYNKATPEDCFWTPNAKLFPSLVKLIESMPFDGIGRVMFFMTEANNQTVPHYDVANDEQRAEKPNDDFIWLSTKPKSKGIYVMDGETLEKVYPDPTKKFVWWNEMDYHGTDPVDHFSFSIRIDGKFKPEVKAKLTSKD
jgi:hypothetical protein